MYSNPPGELDAAQNQIETSNRRFAEDEFLLSPALTRGKRSIVVRLVYTPQPQPLVVGGTAAASAWSEYRYWAYSYVVPPFVP